MRLERIGTGAGKADPPRANVLRLFVGTPVDAAVDGASAMAWRGQDLPVERLVMLETSIDDMNPQLYPYVMTRLFEAGALDVALVPAIMKKGRPGQLVRVLAAPERAQVLSGILFAETTTLGVRTYEIARHAMERRIVHVETEFGSVPVKIASNSTGIVNVAPEFDACRALAERHGIPLKQVMAAAQQAALREPARTAPPTGEV
jgi:uncharacterized protein (DUF111 family)